ncbi:MAG: stage II sporulation protein R, partial [Oscillospiraceae bacterium]|nr:stage II sporulation protein R [Oscillospiraceae bacterium]
EVALLSGILVAALMGAYLDREQAALADSVIRLHVIANSDSRADQELKYQVRDRILTEAAALYQPGDDLQQVRKSMEDNLTLLAQAGREVVEEQGYDYPVSAKLERTWFPTKKYTDFALPAGNYTALRIVVGEGKGENWWCVAFPPLCLGSVSETVDEAAAAGSFTPEQVSLITGESGGYVVKFKAMELWEEFKKMWE